MFETSVKENNELREFTTLEKQMFYENVSNQQMFMDLSSTAITYYTHMDVNYYVTE